MNKAIRFLSQVCIFIGQQQHNMQHEVLKVSYHPPPIKGSWGKKGFSFCAAVIQQTNSKNKPNSEKKYFCRKCYDPCGMK